MAAKPDVVIHQLTDLPDVIEPDKMPAALAANARLRIEGTYNLIVAAKTAGARRIIAQSIAFMYAPGKPPYRETDPLAPCRRRAGAACRRAAFMRLRARCLARPGSKASCCGTAGCTDRAPGREKPDGPGFVHTDAAAQAALLAVTQGAPGIYNIAEDDGAVDMSKARHDLGFDPAFRISAGLNGLLRNFESAQAVAPGCVDRLGDPDPDTNRDVDGISGANNSNGLVSTASPLCAPVIASASQSLPGPEHSAALVVKAAPSPHGGKSRRWAPAPGSAPALALPSRSHTKFRHQWMPYDR